MYISAMSLASGGVKFTSYEPKGKKKLYHHKTFDVCQSLILFFFVENNGKFTHMMYREQNASTSGCPLAKACFTF